ncbi:hypothetical protein HG530_003469 [Fusarium avenaceum]|nr:hypothetical protein HG530_003469 [Fusarium avenaceum]
MPSSFEQKPSAAAKSATLWKCVAKRERAFTGHIGTRDEPDTTVLWRPYQTVIAHKASTLLKKTTLNSGMSPAYDGVTSRIVQNRSHEVLFASELSKGCGDVEFIKDDGITAQLDKILNNMLSKGMEDGLFFSTNLGANLVKTLPEMGPFRDVERSCRAARRESLYIGKIARIFAPDMSNVTESRCPPKRQTWGVEAFTKCLVERRFFLYQSY